LSSTNPFPLVSTPLTSCPHLIMSESHKCPSCYLPQNEFAPSSTLHPSRIVSTNHACALCTTTMNDNVPYTCGTRQNSGIQERLSSESQFEGMRNLSQNSFKPSSSSTGDPPPPNFSLLSRPPNNPQHSQPPLPKPSPPTPHPPNKYSLSTTKPPVPKPAT